MTTSDNAFEAEQTSPEPSDEELLRERGRQNLVRAWQWIRENMGAGGAWRFILRWLDKALTLGKPTSLRCAIDTLAEVKMNFTDVYGHVPSTGHSLSGAMSRIIVVLHPAYSEILEQRPSKLLDGFSSEDVLALCPFDRRAFDL